MSARPAAAKAQAVRKEAAIAEFEEKKAQLKQYSDDNGHFSLVRCVLRASLAFGFRTISSRRSSNWHDSEEQSENVGLQLAV